MSGVGHAIGGLFDGIFGNNSQGGIDPNLQAQQAELEKQQKADLENKKRQVERQRIDMMRGRFSGSGGAPQAQEDMGQQAANLFSRITGRTE
jgi:hypothetical protein